jgi:hypothetical protein
MRDFADKVGELIVGKTRKQGKVVDEWYFSSPFGSSNRADFRAKAPKLEVSVSIDKSDRGTLTFVARGDCLPASISDSDINRLKEKVEEKLRFQHNMLTGVKWEDWLQVRVTEAYSSLQKHQGSAGGLQVTYARLKRGVDPDTGEIYTINTNGVVVDFPLPKKSGELDIGASVEDVWNLSNSRPQADAFSYIPESAENIAALEDVMSKMAELRKRLAGLLEQDTISKSLANATEALQTTPLLPNSITK